MAANCVLKYKSSNENGNVNSTIQSNITDIAKKLDFSENMEHMSVNLRTRSAQKSVIPEAGCWFLTALCQPCKDIPTF